MLDFLRSSDATPERILQQVASGPSSERLHNLLEPILDRLQFGDALRHACELCIVEDLPILRMMKRVVFPQTVQQAKDHLSADDQAFAVLTDTCLLNLVNEEGLHLDCQNLMLQLCAGQSHQAVYHAAKERRMVLLNDGSKAEDQACLMDINTIGPLTLRIKELIKQLSRPGQFQRTLFLELLGLCSLVNHFSNQLWIERTREDSAPIKTFSVRPRASGPAPLDMSRRRDHFKQKVAFLRYGQPVGRKIRKAAQQSGRALYVLSSYTPDFKDYVSAVKSRLLFSGIPIRVITGTTIREDRTIEALAPGEHEIVIISDGVLPHKDLPHPVFIDPYLSEAPASLVKGAQKIKALHLPGNPPKDISRRELQEAVFGRSSLTVLESELKELLEELLMHYELDAKDFETLDDFHLDQGNIDTLSKLLNGQPQEEQVVIEDESSAGIRPFDRMQIPGDGSCLFHSLSLSGLGEGQLNAQELRNELAQHMLNNSEYYKVLLHDSDLVSMERALENTQDLSPAMRTTLRNSLSQLRTSTDREQYELRRLEYYCLFLKETRLWGGDVELSAAADRYGREIVVRYVLGNRSPRIEHKRPSGRVLGEPIYLEYNGDHYTSLIPRD